LHPGIRDRKRNLSNQAQQQKSITEADPVAVLGQFLAAFEASARGRQPQLRGSSRSPGQGKDGNLLCERYAKDMREMVRDDDARAMWSRVYPELSAEMCVQISVSAA
jgi:hypothetical protein